MSFFGIFGTRKEEVLKTEDLRRKTEQEARETKASINEEYDHLSNLMEETLRELGKPPKLLPYHPNNRRN